MAKSTQGQTISMYVSLELFGEKHEFLVEVTGVFWDFFRFQLISKSWKDRGQIVFALSDSKNIND